LNAKNFKTNVYELLKKTIDGAHSLLRDLGGVCTG
jgi:hypothetical protein